MYDAGLLREILDAQLEMVCRYAADGTIRFANRAYAASLGTVPERLAGQSLWDFVAAEDRARVEAQLFSMTPDRTEVVIENRFETTSGTRWLLWTNHALSFDSGGQLLLAQSTGIDITERKMLEERMQLLIDELNHRVKNTLMVVQAMAHQSFRDKDVPAAPLAAFSSRLSALGAAHTALSDANWAGARIDTIVQQGIAMCRQESSRVSASGPPLTLAAGPTVPLVLALHELATNSLKYGALSHKDGSVGIEWRTIEPAGWVELLWEEHGGPPVRVPAARGFGTRLISSAVPQQLGGTAELTFAPEGVRCRLSFPAAGAGA